MRNETEAKLLSHLSMFSEEKMQACSFPSGIVTISEHKRKKKRTYDDWMSELPVEETFMRKKI